MHPATPTVASEEAEAVRSSCWVWLLLCFFENHRGKFRNTTTWRRDDIQTLVLPFSKHILNRTFSWSYLPKRHQKTFRAPSWGGSPKLWPTEGGLKSQEYICTTTGTSVRRQGGPEGGGIQYFLTGNCSRNTFSLIPPNTRGCRFPSILKDSSIWNKPAGKPCPRATSSQIHISQQAF